MSKVLSDYKTETRNNVANQFIALRIAEFPSLYKNSNQVLLRCVFENQGSPEWDENGLLVQTDQHYNEKTKRWGKYPLRMPIDTAFDLINPCDFIVPNAYSYNGPISRLPNNCHPDWLNAIDLFLFGYREFGPEQINHLSIGKCMMQYSGLSSNPAAAEPDRTITNFTNFVKRIPDWRAQIENIEFIQRNGYENATRFLGEGI